MLGWLNFYQLSLIEKKGVKWWFGNDMRGTYFIWMKSGSFCSLPVSGSRFPESVPLIIIWKREWIEKW